jgi:hypothetical protein
MTTHEDALGAPVERDERGSHVRANRLELWLAPVRNHDWIAARIGLN